MKRCLTWVLAMGLSAVFVGGAKAHVGDRIYYLWQLSDEDVAAIDLKDRSVEDWVDIVGEPTMTTVDFGNENYDPSDLEFRIWLAWHEPTNRIYGAVERYDDTYAPLTTRFNRVIAHWHDAAINLYIDGDHSGGDFIYPWGDGMTEDEYWSNTFQGAQQFTAKAEDLEGYPLVEMWYLAQATSSKEDWFIQAPYAEGGGGLFGETPTVSITEFFVTPFDFLVWNSPEESAVSDLQPGQTIGFGVQIFDTDKSFWASYWMGNGITGSADSFADGLLLGMGGVMPGDTAIQDVTWARIKASFPQ